MAAAAAANPLTGLQVADQADRARLVFRFPAEPEFQLTRWAEPNRLLVDLPGAELAVSVKPPPSSHPFLGKIRTTTKEGRKELCFAVDFKRHVVHDGHVIHGKGRYQLIVELADAKSAGKAFSPSARRQESGRSAKVGCLAHQRRKPKPWVVAIDAGHGGKDTGALGPQGRREKDVVLAIARKLTNMIQASALMRPVMVRRNDRFIPLRQRLAVARRARARLLLSLHADAHANAEARGITVFTLSSRGARNEASRWLVPTSGHAGLLNGVKLSGKDRTARMALLSQSQTATLEASERAAAAVLHELTKNFQMHRAHVQKAGFVVLKSPDIPSILVETGFISNPVGERMLSSASYQEKIARAIFYGVRGFFSSHKTILALQRDVDT